MAEYTGGAGAGTVNNPFGKSSVYSDEIGMPSKEAQNARAKTEDILDALRYGKPGEADAMMGKQERSGDGALRWMKRKLSGKKEEKKEGAALAGGSVGVDVVSGDGKVKGSSEDGVIR